MERSTLLILVSVLTYSLFISCIATAAPPDKTWKLIREEGQVSVYTHGKKGSQYDEWLAQTKIKSTLSALVVLIMDGDNHANWIHSINQSRILKKLGDTKIYNYTYSKAPWPVEDRDAIVLSSVKQDRKTLKVTISSHAEPDYLPVKEGVIRIPYVNSSWTLAPRPDGLVEVSYKVHNDPGGQVPSWLINNLASDQPFKTLINLRRIIENKKDTSDSNLLFIREPKN